ncbi:aldo/keto reductase [Microbacterium sp. KSW4-11]|uniref:Aldo/keto reductase n=1 Tax=Microbacterium gawkjiense TaxID=3067309 RepID=A0ABU3GE21_9MICO|nr:aldo/keto reductase [Microbacterium sp. KSW4-11]MDT3318054.1 aldo/keto reductase [Microbacterium sp. KSW4-11]
MTIPALPSRSIRGNVPVTEVGFGAAQLGNLNRTTTDDESTSAVHAARAAGITYFDTAPHYGLGLSERRLGRALAETPREEIIISTKVGRLLVDSPDTADLQDGEGFVVPASVRREWDFSADGVKRSIEDSLTRLGTDRIDIVYLHDPDDHEEQATREALPALLDLRAQGVIRAVGAGMNQSAMPARFIEAHDLDVVMLAGRLTLLDQTGLTDLMPLAARRGVAVVAAGVYNSGLLSSTEISPDAHFDYAPASSEMLARARRLAAICRSHSVDLPSAAVQYSLRHPAVVSAVIGMRTAAHVESSIDRRTTDIPDELWVELDAEGLAPDLTKGN